MAGMKLKNGADLCGFELRRFTIQNDSSDPTDLKVGRKYFNNGGGTAHLRERIYVGDKSITTDGWRDAAYMDDIKRLEGIIGSLDGNVGENLLGLAEQLNAVQAKVDAFLEGDVDADAVLENLNELKQFLDTYSGDVTLSQVLNDINEEVAKKADKATTLAGYGIADAVRYNTYISLNDGTLPLNAIGYGMVNYGWRTNGPAMSIGYSQDYWMQLQLDYFYGLHYRASVGNSLNWCRILDENNYATVLGTVYAPYNAAGYLPKSGGALTGGLYMQDAYIFLDSSNLGSARISNTYQGVEVNAIALLPDGFYIKSQNTPVYVNHEGVNSNMLHEGNYESIVGNKFLKLSGGTITGNILVSVASQSPIVIKNTAQEWVGLGFAGKNNSGYAFISYSKNEDGSEGWSVTNDGWSKVSALLHSDNYNSYAPKLDGTGASGTWGIDISGKSDYFNPQQITTADLGSEALLNRFFITRNGAQTDIPVDFLVGFTMPIDSNPLYRVQFGMSLFGTIYTRATNGASTYGDWKRVAFTDSDITGNAASATKLADNNAYTAWGQKFFENGKPKNVSGDIRLPNYKALQSYTVGGTLRNLVVFNTADNLDIGDANYDTNLIGNKLIFKTGSYKTSMVINSSGNVTLGESDLALTNWKLYVDGYIGLRNNYGIWSYLADGTYAQVLGINKGNQFYIGSQALVANGANTYIVGKTVSLMTGTIAGFRLNEYSNVTIGDAEYAGETYKLFVHDKKTFIHTHCGETPALGSLPERGLILGHHSNGTPSFGMMMWTEGNGRAGIQVGRYNGTAEAFNLCLNPNGGNVGIGTSNPKYKLDVNGNVGFNGTLTLPINHQVQWGDSGLMMYGSSTALTLVGNTEINGTAKIYGVANLASRLLVGGAVDDGTSALKVHGTAIITNHLRAEVSLAIASSAIVGHVLGGNEYYSYIARAKSGQWEKDIFQFHPNNDNYAYGRFIFDTKIESPNGIKIGDATLSWDSVNNALKVDKSFYSTEEVSAGGVGSGTTSGGGGGTNNTKAFDIPIGTESMTFAHNLGTKDVIVAIYEISDSYQQILADVIINNISEVTIMFGEATEVAHRVVIMG